jgi:hypothetical protein
MEQRHTSQVLRWNTHLRFGWLKNPNPNVPLEIYVSHREVQYRPEVGCNLRAGETVTFELDSTCRKALRVIPV